MRCYIYLRTKSILVLNIRIVEKVNKAKFRRLASLDLQNHKGRLDYCFALGSALVGNGNRN